MLTEHNMKEFEIAKLNINNFQVSSFYSRRSTLGGVWILSKPNIKEICIPAVQNLIMGKEFECALVEIKTNRSALGLTCVYRTPRQCFTNTFLEKLEHFAYNFKQEVYSCCYCRRYKQRYFGKE